MTQRIKIKTRSGTINEMEIEELMEVDGKPFVEPVSELQALRDTLLVHQGQIETIMFLISGKEQADGGD